MRETVSTGVREPCPLTPAELVTLAAGRTTELAREVALEPFKGKWLRLTGRVTDVSQNFGGGVSVGIVLADDSEVCLWMKEELYAKEDLADVKKDDMFTAEGKVDSVAESGRVYLRDCERPTA